MRNLDPSGLAPDATKGVVEGIRAVSRLAAGNVDSDKRRRRSKGAFRDEGALNARATDDGMATADPLPDHPIAEVRVLDGGIAKPTASGHRAVRG
jgi:hypothetical protein